MASQKVLTKIGMKNKGLCSRDYSALRGDEQIVRWEMTREEWQKRIHDGK